MFAHERAADWPVVIVTVLTMVVFLRQTAVFSSTLKETRDDAKRQHDDTMVQLEQAKAEAESQHNDIVAQLKVARDQATNNRAHLWLYVEPGGISGPYQGGARWFYFFRFRLKNFGQSPAILTGLQIRAFLVGFPSDNNEPNPLSRSQAEDVDPYQIGGFPFAIQQYCGVDKAGEPDVVSCDQVNTSEVQSQQGLDIGKRLLFRGIRQSRLL